MKFKIGDKVLCKFQDQYRYGGEDTLQKLASRRDILTITRIPINHLGSNQDGKNSVSAKCSNGFEWSFERGELEFVGQAEKREDRRKRRKLRAVSKEYDEIARMGADDDSQSRR